MAGSKLPSGEIEKRVDKCVELRYASTDGMLQKDWIKYCHEVYGDKSEQQYHAYWSKAKEKYEEWWRERLNKQMDPAVQELYRLLGDENPKVRADAVKMIFKYTGNDIERQEINLKVTEIETKWE